VLKIAVLNLFLAMVPAVAASVALIERRGLPGTVFSEIVGERDRFPPLVADLARRMMARDFSTPINDVRGVIKDLAVLDAELREAGLPRAAELLAPYRQLLAAAAARGCGPRDMIAAIDLLQEPPPSPGSAP
jgi:3-hydroxyisobutyrate dehydrogenase-like beta-hydroxyacid dehydrogenase